MSIIKKILPAKQMNEQSIKILMVEDNDFDFDLIERKLKTLNHGYKIKRAMIEEDFKSLLDQFRPDLILSDFSLPTFSGLKALEIAKKKQPLIPFIFISGTMGEEIAVETLKQGASDYVLKDKLNKLDHSIKRALSEAKEKEKRKEAEVKLEVTVEELKKLVYRISHDIRGPICSIKGVVSLIQESNTEISDEMDQYIDIIGHVTERMENIVLNLSSFQYIYAENPQAENLTVDVLLAQIKKAASQIEGFNEVDFQVTLTGFNDIFFEYNLLFSTLLNLIHNSIVFRDKYKSPMKINCLVDVSEKEICFIVEDNGIGIPAKLYEKIWEMFFRGSTLSKGAGLGLYITKTIIEKLNGNIKLESKEGIGTTIKITIPILFGLP